MSRNLIFQVLALGVHLCVVPEFFSLALLDEPQTGSINNLNPRLRSHITIDDKSTHDEQDKANLVPEAKAEGTQGVRRRDQASTCQVPQVRLQN
jgi:hypothetical protein